MISVRSVWKKLRPIVVVLLILFVCIQFVRPGLDNPPVTGDFKAPADVKAVIQRACYDCHSNETHLAWFDMPAPAYWLVADHVKKGRKVLNFSNWDSLSKGQQLGKLYESLNQIEYNVMPLSQYTAFHHGGRVTPEEIALLRQYLLSLTPRVAPDTAKQRASVEQYEKWIIEAVGSRGPVADEYNGIGYSDLAGFRNWTAISTTERYDNGTLRLILGNDVVERAIREGHTNPWPKGAVFAKVAWDQLPDSAGEIRTGAFKQVEFMIRDGQKYSTTGGWGWARWVGGLGMKPYGKDASFTMECINCHKPMQPNDQTFTIPLADTLAVNGLGASDTLRPMTGKVITTVVHQREGSMSTLYGNDVAIKDARAGRPYSVGAVVTLVTWEQRDDPHWFGGRIPAAVHAVEVVRYMDGGPSYQSDKGSELVKEARISYIAGLKAAVLP